MACIAPTCVFSDSVGAELHTSLTPSDVAEGKAELPSRESGDDRPLGEQSNPPPKSQSGDEEEEEKEEDCD